MRYTEELNWILDKPGTSLRDQEDKYRENIAFVHSLGLKCDSVGWSRLELTDPRAEEIFAAIGDFCRRNGWQARCCYTRRYEDVVSDWFVLDAAAFREISGIMELPGEGGGSVRLHCIRACNEPGVGPKWWGRSLYVPERFRDACIRHGWTELDFCWAPDKGRYQAEQYFQVCVKQLIPRVGVAWGLKNAGPEALVPAGGWLPRIGQVFHTLQIISLPDVYLRSDLPEGGMAVVYIPATFSCAGRHSILIHREVAEILLAERAVSARHLQPAPVVDALPGGYIAADTQPVPCPAAEAAAKLLIDCAQLAAKERPVRMATDKDALKALRAAKKERPADFRKALSKAAAAALADTACAPLAPYCLVTDGCILSDEYELLARARSEAATEAFRQAMTAEELLADKPEGIVIAECADGDPVLLTAEGAVIRVSHEEPAAVMSWPGLAQFIVESLEA